jgi:hypothetical protein
LSYLTDPLLSLEDMLTDEFASDPRVRLGHMACAIDGGSVVFLYRLEDGVCPRSYGINVARMAGLPKQVRFRFLLCLDVTFSCRWSSEPP